MILRSNSTMEIISNVIKQDMQIDTDVIITGIVTGNIVIERGGLLILTGMGNGRITVNQSGKCEVHGMFNGIIENNGGILNIFGVVNGSIIENSGNTIIDTNAVIKVK